MHPVATPVYKTILTCNIVRAHCESGADSGVSLAPCVRRAVYELIV